MFSRSLPSYRYRYAPPYPWRGPRPVVDAAQVQKMTRFRHGDSTVTADGGEWVLRTRDGNVETMADRTFRRWYTPVDDAAAAALRGERPPRRPRRSRRRPVDKRQHQLGI